MLDARDNMYALMDHEDIIKSRKALMVTSLFLIILHSFQISGQTINIFGLEAKFDKELSLGLCGLAVFYFLYIFILKVVESKVFEAIEFRIQNYKLLLEDLKKRVDDPDYFTKEESKIIPPGIEYRERKDWIDSIKTKLDQAFISLKMITFLLVDVCPPLLFAIFAIKKTHALSAVASILAVN